MEKLKKVAKETIDTDTIDNATKKVLESLLEASISRLDNSTKLKIAIDH